MPAERDWGDRLLTNAVYYQVTQRAPHWSYRRVSLLLRLLVADRLHCIRARSFTTAATTTGKLLRAAVRWPVAAVVSRPCTSNVRSRLCRYTCLASTDRHSVGGRSLRSVDWRPLCDSLFQPLLLAAVLLSLLSYIALFSSDKAPPPPLSPDPLTAAGQWLAGTLLAIVLTGGRRALASVCLVFLLCVVQGLLRSVSFTSRTHARAAMVACRTPVVQLIKRVEQQDDAKVLLRRRSQAAGHGD